MSKLPLKFAYSSSGAPVSANAAISAAMQTWNIAFPGNKIGCNPLCLSPSGTSTISWGSPAACGGSPTALAVSCITYSSPGKILKVDIILNSNPSITWVNANPVQLATGESTGATWGDLPGGNWYDVQSVLTHEFGHALGLEHIGNATNPFPFDVTDSWKYQETMYRHYYPGSTSPRTLGPGDIAGLYRVAFDTYSD